MTAIPVDSVLPTNGTTVSSRQRTARVDSVDLLRGLVMVLMVLDHTRDFVHINALQDPTNLTSTTVSLFLTRWVTHLCAPTFVFLAGTGAYLQHLRGKSVAALSQFLLTRGLWLIVLEFTVVHFGVGFRMDTTFLGMAQVIWVIGVSMIVLAALVWLPLWVIGGFGVVMIAGHNAFDGMRAAPWGGPGTPLPSVGNWLWTLLHQPGMLPLASGGTPMAFNLYPLIPWVGVMAMGYVFGAMYRLPAEQRPARIAGVGTALLGIFVVLRALNIYGDPTPWTSQRSAVFTILSFIKVQKYPPSLLYLCVMLGISLLLLAWFEHRQARSHPVMLERILITFGRVPLFFYLLQWYVAHGLALIAVMATGQDATRLLYNPLMVPPGARASGFSLPVVYLFWLLAIVLLYFPCRWFAGVKGRRRDWWLSYL